MYCQGAIEALDHLFISFFFETLKMSYTNQNYDGEEDIQVTLEQGTCSSLEQPLLFCIWSLHRSRILQTSNVICTFD